MYFMARKTAIDCLEKRKQRGYLFIIGDEMPYRVVRRREGGGTAGRSTRIGPPQWKRSSVSWNANTITYFILPNLTSYYDDPPDLSPLDRSDRRKGHSAGRPAGHFRTD